MFCGLARLRNRGQRNKDIFVFRAKQIVCGWFLFGHRNRICGSKGSQHYSEDDISK